MIYDEYGSRRFYGVYRGIVVENQDPKNQFRLKLKIPQVLHDQVSDWAWANHPSGIKSILAPIGTAVWVMFEGGDPSFPMWLGNSQELPPTDTPFNVVGGTLGTQPTFTGTPLFTGSYVKEGPMVHFRIDVDMDNITSFGSGQYYMNLPFSSKYNYQFAAGCLHDISTGTDYPIFGHVLAGSKQMLLKSIDSHANSAYNVAFTPTAPFTLAVADNFHIAGDYITTEDL
jgi:hypothetical protein